MSEERRREVASRVMSCGTSYARGAPARTVVIRLPFVRLPRAPAAANAYR